MSEQTNKCYKIGLNLQYSGAKILILYNYSREKHAESFIFIRDKYPKEKVTEFFDKIGIIDFTLDDARKSSEIKALLRTKGT